MAAQKHAVLAWPQHKQAATHADSMLKTYAHYGCLAAALLFIQTTPLLPFGNHGIRPDLFLFLVLNASITVTAGHCACIVFVLGFFLEALSGAPTGLFISIYLLVFAGIRLLCCFFNFNTLIELFGLLLLALVLKYLLICFFMYFIYELHYDALINTVFSETFFTLIVFPFVFPLLRKALSTAQPPGGKGRNRYYHGA